MAFYSLMPLGPMLAAEVLGVDLAAPLDADTAEALGAALAAHLVLVFRGQSLTREQYLEAAAALQLPAATLLYRAEVSAAVADTDIARLRAAVDQLPPAEQQGLGGKAPEEVKAYLRDAMDRIEAFALYRHAWRGGDLLLIDDRGTVHRDPGDGALLWRIVVDGDTSRFG